MTITKLEGGENVKKICSGLEEVVKKTYHRKIGVGFVYNQEFLGRFALEAQKGWLRAYILYIDDIPEAFWLGYLCHGTFYLAFTGYNPAYRKYELGTIVFINLLEDLGRMGVSKVDFGSGTALYKERFGQHMWHEATVYIFAPTLRGIILNVSKSFFSFINNAAKKILDKTNLLQNVKTQWRTSLQKRQKGYLLNK